VIFNLATIFTTPHLASSVPSRRILKTEVAAATSFLCSGQADFEMPTFDSQGMVAGMPIWSGDFHTERSMHLHSFKRNK